MKLLGLIGFPLSHSFSKKHFTKKFIKEGIPNFKYELFPLSNIDELPQLLESHPNLVGLNITIPYKLQVFKYLDRIEESAQKIGAVNCIKFENNELIGYNTDIYGFEHSLLKFLNEEKVKQALVLGTGGASKAVVYVLNKLGISTKLVSRSEQKGDLTYSNISDQILETHQLIINTTPLGTYPNIEAYPDLNYRILGKTHYLYDLVYNPEKSLFLKKGENQDAKICNGLDMLYLQAEKGWEIWND